MVPAAFIGKAISAFVESALQTPRLDHISKGAYRGLTGLPNVLSNARNRCELGLVNTKIVREVSYFHILGSGKHGSGK